MLAGILDFVLPSWVKYVGVGVALIGVAFGSWWFTAEYKNAVWQSKFDTYKRKLAELHAKNLNEVLQKEREAQERADEIEVKYHDATTEIRTIRNDNARLARELGGLRDPGKRPVATSGMGNSQGTTPGDTANAAAESRLSREATRFLLDFAEDADRAAAYANACYEWVNRGNAPEVIPKPPDPKLPAPK